MDTPDALTSAANGMRVQTAQLDVIARNLANTSTTGYRARTWKKLAEFYPSPGFLAEKMTIYIATGLSEGVQTPMEDERIQTRWFSAAEIDRMIDRGKILDGKTMIGFLKWRRYFAGK